MATETKKVIKRVSFVWIHKLAVGVFLLAFVVMCMAGVRGGAGIWSTLTRVGIVGVVVWAVTRVVLKILESYEEMNSGKG